MTIWQIIQCNERQGIARATYLFQSDEIMSLESSTFKLAKERLEKDETEVQRVSVEIIYFTQCSVVEGKSRQQTFRDMSQQRKPEFLVFSYHSKIH